MYIQRQIAAFIATGNVPTIAEAQVFPFRLRDVRASLILKLGDGKVAGDAIRLNAAGSYLVPMPQDYNSANQLFYIFRATSVASVTITSAEHPNSKALIKCGTDYPGIYQGIGRVTTLTLANPHATDPTEIEYLLYEVPDLTLAASFRGGNNAFGYVVS